VTISTKTAAYSRSKSRRATAHVVRSEGGQLTARPGAHVLIILQNLPVPLDRRVWLECQALVASGYKVSVICPKGPGDPSRQLIDGVHI
jgi:hypothetical protein